MNLDYYLSWSKRLRTVVCCHSANSVGFHNSSSACSLTLGQLCSKLVTKFQEQKYAIVMLVASPIRMWILSTSLPTQCARITVCLASAICWPFTAAGLWVSSLSWLCLGQIVPLGRFVTSLVLDTVWVQVIGLFVSLNQLFKMVSHSCDCLASSSILFWRL